MSAKHLLGAVLVGVAVCAIVAPVVYAMVKLGGWKGLIPPAIALVILSIYVIGIGLLCP